MTGSRRFTPEQNAQSFN